MTTADCPDANRLLGYVTHRLDETAQDEVEEHLDTCSACLTLLVELVRFDPADRNAPLLRAEDGGEGEQGEAIAPVATPAAPAGLFGKYRLEAVVGQGAMGTVYAAHDCTLDRKVALKILRPHADAGGARGRLTRESRAMARLSHPNVVTVYDAGELDERLYIAMELFSGSTLASWLRETGAADATSGDGSRRWEEALALLLRAGEGLAAAHAAGLTHRDFKPENVLLGAIGEQPRRVVVTDFGLVAAPGAEVVEIAPAEGEGSRDGGADVALTRTGVIVGTPRYMSPEQFRGAAVDPRSDQFSFAVTVYEALYRQAPFAGRTLEELRGSVLEGVVAAPPAGTLVPAAIHRALLRALATDPEARHPALADLLHALAAAAPRRTTRGVAAITRLGGAALLAAAVGAAAFFLRPAAPREAVTRPVSTAAPSASSPATQTATRTAVVVGPLANLTGDPRLDPVIATMLATDIGCSRSFDGFTEWSAVDLAEDVGAPPDATTAQAIAAAAASAGRDVVELTGEVTSAASGNILVSISASRAKGETAAKTWTLEASADGSDLARLVPGLALRVRAALGEGEAAAGSRPAFSTSLAALSAWSAGRRSFAARDWAAADTKAAAALAADPSFQLARADLGLDLARQSRATEAAAALQSVVDHPDALCERERLFIFGTSSGVNTRNAAATHAFQQYLALWPGDLSVQARLTLALLDDRDFPLALDVARSALADHPRSVQARASLASALFMTGAFADVVREGEALRRSVARPPERVLTRLVASHALLDQDEAALAVVHQQATYDEEIADEEEADLAMFRGRLDDAEVILRRRIRALLAENDGDVTYARTENLMLAQLLVRRGDLAGARTVAKVAIVGAEAEAWEGMLYDLGQIFLATSSEPEVARIAAELSKRSVLHGRSLARLFAGDRLRARGKRDEAAAAYDEAIRLEDWWIAHVRVGELAIDRGDWVTAERELAKCVTRRSRGLRSTDAMSRPSTPAERRPARRARGCAPCTDGASTPRR